MSRLQELMGLNMLNKCAYEGTKQSRWKETTQRYLSNLLVNNLELQDEVMGGGYAVKPTIDFELNERGHIRQIEAPVVRDRVIQKSFTKNILTPSLRPCLIYDNYASLKQRGTTFARKRFEIMIRRYIARNGTDGYILLGDISKYFENIDHDVLKSLIAPRLAGEPAEIMAMIHYIIDTSSHSNKGLNLGSEAPQIFAVFYLNLIDTLVKVVKSTKYYGRYMDDWFAIFRTKHEAEVILSDVEESLSILRLNLNRKKTIITKLGHGFTFLQVKYNILPSGKILKRPTRGKIVRERRRLKAFRRMLDKGQMTENEIWNCYQSWRGTFIHEHNAYRKTIMSMDRLYLSLFPEHEPYIRKGRKELYDEAFKEAETGDLKYLFN